MKLSSELNINNPSCVTSTLLVFDFKEKLSKVNSVSGNSAVVLPFTSTSTFFCFKDSSTSPFAPANNGFSIVNPVSSFTEPDKITLTKSAAPGKSADAPKLLY